MISKIEDIIEDIRQGKMVILMDDENRENEGDLIIAAEYVSPEMINFMVTEGRGLVCLTITQERFEQLKLWYQSGHNTSPFHTNFTVSIEAAEGITTGISAADRALTIKAAVAKNARPEDLVQPGHIFPIVARGGGVLVRAGHTEASTDLARLAGLEPAGVIVEILNADGTMARRPDLEIFAEKHGIKIGTIADLITYRLQREQTIHLVAESPFSSMYGEFHLSAYQDLHGRLHYAVRKGVIKSNQPTFVRVHVQGVLTDLFGANLNDRSISLDVALKRLAAEESGLVIVVDDEQQEPEAIISRIHDLAANRDQKRPTTLQTYGIGAQILLHQNVRKMRLLSNPYKFNAISAYPLEITEYLTI